MKTKNINNLIELWETAANTEGEVIERPDFKAAIDEKSDWPNRIWTKNYSIDALNSIQSFMAESKAKLTLPIWNSSNDIKHHLKTQNLIMKFKQVGMSLELKSKYEFEKRLIINKVTGKEEARIWEEIYPMAFGYRIRKEMILSSRDKINFYMALFNDSPVGTAITFYTDDFVGIHGVGVVPSARRKGFADEIMKHVLNESYDNGFTTSFLQASDMGKNIYLRMGYKEDFTIQNYIL